MNCVLNFLLGRLGFSRVTETKIDLRIPFEEDRIVLESSPPKIQTGHVLATAAKANGNTTASSEPIRPRPPTTYDYKARRRATLMTFYRACR